MKGRVLLLLQYVLHYPNMADTVHRLRYQKFAEWLRVELFQNS